MVIIPIYSTLALLNFCWLNFPEIDEHAEPQVNFTKFYLYIGFPYPKVLLCESPHQQLNSHWFTEYFTLHCSSKAWIFYSSLFSNSSFLDSGLTMTFGFFDLQKTRKILTEKIAQLNSAIDDVSAQLRTEDDDAPNGVAVNSGEVEANI